MKSPATAPVRSPVLLTKLVAMFRHGDYEECSRGQFLTTAARESFNRHGKLIRSLNRCAVDNTKIISSDQLRATRSAFALAGGLTPELSLPHPLHATEEFEELFSDDDHCNTLAALAVVEKTCASAEVVAVITHLELMDELPYAFCRKHSIDFTYCSFQRGDGCIIDLKNKTFEFVKA